MVRTHPLSLTATILNRLSTQVEVAAEAKVEEDNEVAKAKTLTRNILTAIRTMHQPWYHIIYHSVVPIVVVEVEPQDSVAVQADAAGSA